MSDDAGRTCPLRYRYGAASIAARPSERAETLYVIGGLYGNLPALDRIEAMAAAEDGPVTLVFNGDFNWFNVDHEDFAEINRRVQAHRATLGNVEAELGMAGDEAGCGCAYPDNVDAGVVTRSNQIHARLKTTAAGHHDVLTWLATLPMTMRYQVADCTVGIVHGDADTLAGWRFDPTELDAPANQAWLAECFQRAQVDIFASTHTCQPALRQISHPGGKGYVINNGAAGMPNTPGQRSGLLTRISTRKNVHPSQQGARLQSLWIDALPIAYDHAEWEKRFLANWPEGSAWQSYYRRIVSVQTA
ncbi:MAG: hypothetical protein IPN40_13655 [Uliginosibacterium sp.]|nr:hypothetical protein [Uliginosibacterium sp.]